MGRVKEAGRTCETEGVLRRPRSLHQKRHKRRVWARQIQSDSKQVVAREEGEWVLNGHRVSFADIENILELDHSYGCTTF